MVPRCQEVADFAAETDPSLCLPFSITGTEVNGLPVTHNKDVQWTRAMKYLVTDVKWLLSWASRMIDD
jgi:beclin 1